MAAYAPRQKRVAATRARRVAQRDSAKTAAGHATPSVTTDSTALSAGNLVALQRTLGNGALLRLLDAQADAQRKLIPGVQRVGDIITPPPTAGNSAHPTLTKGGSNNAAAVEEAQQKLATSPGGPAALPITGVYDDATEVAVKAFRVKNGLSESGTVDKATWDFLDAQGKSSVGRIERPWEETVGGVTFGMTSKYQYKIDATKITVTVGINFVADTVHPPADLSAVVTKWKTRILGRWNQFKAVKDDGSASRDIVFEIVDSGGNTVKVINADVGSDAGNWSVPDNENDNGPAHEFGHMIGLADEYQQTMEDYKKTHPGISAADLEKAKTGGEYTDQNSMMGMGALKSHSDKKADPEPRHLREFVSFVEKFCGGKWEAAKK